MCTARSPSITYSRHIRSLVEKKTSTARKWNKIVPCPITRSQQSTCFYVAIKFEFVAWLVIFLEASEDETEEEEQHTHIVRLPSILSSETTMFCPYDISLLVFFYMHTRIPSLSNHLHNNISLFRSLPVKLMFLKCN